MKRDLPLMRLRLELDRTLRSRLFFGRAIRGELCSAAYLDLLSQLAALTQFIGGALSRPALDLATRDLENLAGEGHLSYQVRPPCRVMVILGEAQTRRLSLSPTLLTHRIGLAVLGSSWTRDAAEGLRPSFPRSVSLLNSLAEQGPRHFQAIRTELNCGSLDAEWIHAYAELVRGAILGIATHLDYTWRAPVVALSTPGPGFKSGDTPPDLSAWS